MSDFSRIVNSFSKRFGINSITIVQKTAIDIHKDLINGTPRKTGRAASAWNLTKDNVDVSIPPEGLKDYAGYKNIVKADISLLDHKKNSVIFYISNNLSYIVRLSRGHSKRAPSGWIERIINNYQNYLRKQVK